MRTLALSLLRALFWLGLAIAAGPLLAHNHEDLSMQEQLGYPKDAKLLIIHGDDLGVAHSKNAATFKAMEEGVLTSASVMMNTPWVLEVVDYHKANPEADIGIHITLTAEWDHYKWGPIMGHTHVPSLVTDQGVFHSNTGDFAAAAELDQVEKEVRAQIEYAKSLGIEFTHFDGHMGVMTDTDEIAKLYTKLGHEYGVPIRMHRHAGDRFQSSETKAAITNMPGKVDTALGAPPETYPHGMAAHYDELLRNLKPGLNLIVLHLGYDDPEMQAITVNHPLWGSNWRQIDFDWSMSENTRSIIEEEGIILIDWGEVKEKLFDHAH